MLRGWHAIAGCRRVASWDLVTGSHGTSGISSTAIVACSGVRSVRVPRIFRLNACHSVAWVRAHWSVTCFENEKYLYLIQTDKYSIIVNNRKFFFHRNFTIQKNYPLFQ